MGDDSKSIYSIASYFSAIWIGATFIPVDIALPIERIKYIVLNSNAKHVITISKYKAILCNVKDINVIILDEEIDIFQDNLTASINSVKCCNKNKVDLAYIIYTSGSTGNPKGVMISHQSMMAFVESIVQVVPYYNKSMRYLSLFPFHFDASMCDIYPTLLVGGTLYLMDRCLLPNHLLQEIEKNQITIACISSSFMKLLSSRYASIINYDLSSLQALWFGTESCSIDAIKNVKSKLPKVKFIHSYGPTETTCTSHIYFCSEKDFEISSQVLPIGKPLPKVTSFIINDRGEYAKVGEIGELYISGVQVMLGYCNDVK